MAGPSAQLEAQRDAPVGGQAVLEGVMMRGVSTWAVAVRKPLPERLEGEGLDPEEAARGEIEVVSSPLTSVWRRCRTETPLPEVSGISRRRSGRERTGAMRAPTSS